jgi:hypothetical protein
MYLSTRIEVKFKPTIFLGQTNSIEGTYLVETNLFVKTMETSIQATVFFAF